MCDQGVFVVFRELRVLVMVVHEMIAMDPKPSVTELDARPGGYDIIVDFDPIESPMANARSC
jgi:hypothetical protein